MSKPIVLRRTPELPEISNLDESRVTIVTVGWLQSREHIRIARILEAAWTERRPMDLVTLIQAIQSPPFSRVGALDLEAFYPSRDRFALATAINNLLAAPGFDVWMQGDPLDVSRLLHTADGRPRAAVMSIAHLNDAERMFFVSLLLNEVVGWMRRQTGTTSLRAALYMDEVAGYLPPVANPPSKTPMLTLLKQARVRSGRRAGHTEPGRPGLQGPRQHRHLVPRSSADRTGQGAAPRWPARHECWRVDKSRDARPVALGPRRPCVPAPQRARVRAGDLETRWVLSYLRGPLTRPQHGIGQRFLPIRQPIAAGATIWYEPALYAAASVRVTDTRRQIDDTARVRVVVPIEDGPVPVSWQQADAIDVAPADLDSEPAPGTSFATLPRSASTARSYDAWNRALVAWLTSTHTVDIRVHPATQMHAHPDESDGNFRIRVQEHLHEQRDAAVDALRKKYGSRLTAQQERMRRAEQAIGRQQDQASLSKLQSVVTAATSVLGVFLGRKVVSATSAGRLGTAARSAGPIQKAQRDVSRARETHEAEVRKLADLEAQLEHDIAQLRARYGEVGSFETATLRPKHADVAVQTLTLAWAPHVRLADGTTMRVA